MILLNDLNLKLRKYKLRLNEVIESVVSSGCLILGPQVKRFEESFANYIGSPYCVSVANGTDAIELALKALRIKRGDLVATVANAGMYSTSALMAIGAEPLFLDVDPDTHSTTLSEVERALAAGVHAVIVTHLYGLVVPDICEIAKACARKRVVLIEDCAQAHGARLNGRSVGTFGDAGSFSFYPTKNLGALGDGGAVVTKDTETFERLISLRQYGWSLKYKVEFEGARNSRLDEIQAAILLLFLPDLDDANTRRRAIASYYSKVISHPHITVPPVHGENYVSHLYVIRSSRRNTLRAFLLDHDIATDIHYPTPDHCQPILRNRFRHPRLANVERLAEEILTLPCHPEMTEEQVRLVAGVINSWEI